MRSGKRACKHNRSFVSIFWFKKINIKLKYNELYECNVISSLEFSINISKNNFFALTFLGVYVCVCAEYINNETQTQDFLFCFLQYSRILIFFFSFANLLMYFSSLISLQL